MKQKPTRKITDPKTDEERYASSFSCSLTRTNYTVYAGQPALMGTMALADQRRNKLFNKDYFNRGTDILDQIERM